ncbi:hypothetical protein [Opitutus sp. ER46]|uniref:hypothetical protein n=1 Tax=Opitutus sp. ER46 TaxID=2161864 RepID=UPI000D2F72BF|nr:hypothetical protein [Opitutus sp. ER46]PTX96578.1 hypothetical protein DB354_07940 [Opitutus sp. ER46]
MQAFDTRRGFAQTWALMPQKTSTSGKTVVDYAKREIGGILVRPDSRDVMRKAVEGHPIRVHSASDYVNLYHVFKRMREAGRAGANLELVRRQVAQSEWLLFVLPADVNAPKVEIRAGYDPKRGRYRRYAERLAAGEVLHLDSREEAVKARKAWRLYVPLAQRQGLRSTTKKRPGGGVTVAISKRHAHLGEA